MKVISVVGARPQFVKLAPISRAISDRAEHFIVHTGQHYDDLLSDVFFEDLRIPRPDINLAIGSGLHGAQTGAMLSGLEQAFLETNPDWILTYGDTNSTLAAAIAAVKLHIPVAHLEAGLRSFNRRMPEEHNRVLTDHAADLLLAPTEEAMRHLSNEGLTDRSVLVGDVMTDVLFTVRDSIAGSKVDLPGGIERGNFYLATIHRPENTDDPSRLAEILRQLSQLDKPVLLAVHPRLRDLASRHGLDLDQGVIVPVAPLPYPQLVGTALASSGVITDSGGLQKEAFLLRVPCTTVRAETEWVETVSLGWNKLVGSNLSDLSTSVLRARPMDTDAMPYGDGSAAHRVVDELLNWSFSD